MRTLQSLVRGYLTSAGFRILEEKTDYLVADRLQFGDIHDTWVVWTVPEGQEPRYYESALRASISSIRRKYPDARACVLASSREFSRDFRQTLAEERIQLLIPIWFFDTPFKEEEAPGTASVLRSIRDLAASEKRAPQPFRLEGEMEASGDDLFEQLRQELTTPGAPTVRVIVGRPGIGKSVLFRALFARLYNDFLSAKKQQRIAPRPIPLLPEHLKGTYTLKMRALIDNFLRTEVAAHISEETFKWLLVNGFAIWMLDGLDELYLGDPEFFNDYLLDLLTWPDSRAQVMIWCRDSLLTTSQEFADFREYCGRSAVLKIYHLSEWERPSKRQFAWLRLEGRLPRPDDQDSGRVNAFLTQLDQSPTLRSLSGIPFYCDLLLQQYEAGTLQDFRDDVALLDYVIDQMVDREVKKGLLDLSLFESNGLFEWLEQIALDYVENKYINPDQAREYGRFVLRPDLDEETVDRILTHLVQFPLFRAGEAMGFTSFTHDLIAEALAARAYMRRLPRRPREVLEQLTGVDLEDPTLLRFMASRLTPEAEATLIREMQLGNLRGRSFAVALSLLLLARPEPDLVKRVGVTLEGQDLVAVRFERRDLSSVSFRGSDLSYAVFRDCNLQGARFEGAFLNRTRFEGRNELRGAQFGDLSRIQSVVVGRRLFDDPRVIRAWIVDTTGVPEAPGEPCPTALQLQRLFGKYITPLGNPRRHDLKRDALLAGKRFDGAASPEMCLEEAVRQGYLIGPDFRDRFRRAEGDKYREMVEFVQKSAISDGIGQIIARLCPRRGCLHRLRS